MSTYSCVKESEDREESLADTFKEEKTAVANLFNFESLEKLSYLHDHNQQMKIDLAGQQTTKPDKSLDVVQAELVEEYIVEFLQSFKEKVSALSRFGQRTEIVKKPRENEVETLVSNCGRCQEMRNMMKQLKSEMASQSAELHQLQEALGQVDHERAEFGLSLRLSRDRNRQLQNELEELQARYRRHNDGCDTRHNDSSVVAGETMNILVEMQMAELKNQLAEVCQEKSILETQANDTSTRRQLLKVQANSQLEARTNKRQKLHATNAATSPTTACKGINISTSGSPSKISNGVIPSSQSSQLEKSPCNNKVKRCTSAALPTAGNSRFESYHRNLDMPVIAGHESFINKGRSCGNASVETEMAKLSKTSCDGNKASSMERSKDRDTVISSISRVVEPGVSLLHLLKRKLDALEPSPKDSLTSTSISSHKLGNNMEKVNSGDATASIFTLGRPREKLSSSTLVPEGKLEADTRLNVAGMLNNHEHVSREMVEITESNEEAAAAKTSLFNESIFRWKPRSATLKSATLPSNQNLPDYVTPVRKRGRPRKYAYAFLNIPDDVTPVDATPVWKRGRPRKNASLNLPDDATPVWKLGRPRKNASLSSADIAGLKSSAESARKRSKYEVFYVPVGQNLSKGQMLHPRASGDACGGQVQPSTARNTYWTSPGPQATGKETVTMVVVGKEVGKPVVVQSLKTVEKPEACRGGIRDADTVIPSTSRVVEPDTSLLPSNEWNLGAPNPSKASLVSTTWPSNQNLQDYVAPVCKRGRPPKYASLWPADFAGLKSPDASERKRSNYEIVYLPAGQNNFVKLLHAQSSQASGDACGDQVPPSTARPTCWTSPCPHASDEETLQWCLWAKRWASQ